MECALNALGVRRSTTGPTVMKNYASLTLVARRRPLGCSLTSTSITPAGASTTVERWTNTSRELASSGSSRRKPKCRRLFQTSTLAKHRSMMSTSQARTLGDSRVVFDPKADLVTGMKCLLMPDLLDVAEGQRWLSQAKNYRYFRKRYFKPSQLCRPPERVIRAQPLAAVLVKYLPLTSR